MRFDLDISKSQIDRLGDRLRLNEPSNDDLRLLDVYRNSFRDAYNDVVNQIRSRIRLEPTGREKTNTSIIAKLSRQSIRLSQIQDIAGCRIVVLDTISQDHLKDQINDIFSEVIIDDRRQKPSHGYRAVHMIVMTAGKPVEIQIRTALQHLWAELSEKLSDLINADIKYGGGDPDALDNLSAAAEEILKVEDDEQSLDRVRAELARRGVMSEDMGRTMLLAQQRIAERRKKVLTLIADMGDVGPED